MGPHQWTNTHPSICSTKTWLWSTSTIVWTYSVSTRFCKESATRTLVFFDELRVLVDSVAKMVCTKQVLPSLPIKHNVLLDKLEPHRFDSKARPNTAPRFCRSLLCVPPARRARRVRDVNTNRTQCVLEKPFRIFEPRRGRVFREHGPEGSAAGDQMDKSKCVGFRRRRRQHNDFRRERRGVVGPLSHAIAEIDR